MASIATDNSFSTPIETPQFDGEFVLPSTGTAIQRSIAQSRSAEDQSTVGYSECANSRLEELLVQQNQLMSRHLELVEENHRRVASMQCAFKKPQEILARVDPATKQILNEWRNEFREKVRVYITQSRICIQYDDCRSNGALIRPFSDEARKSWQWPQYYRALAKPIVDIDPFFSDGTAAGMIEDNLQKKGPQDAHAEHTEHPQDLQTCYSIDAAFAELRHRHAQEMQSFVIAHHKACLEEVTKELTLSHQTMALQKKLSSRSMEQADFHNAQVSDVQQQREKDAMKYVEMVFLAEMAKAETKIRENTCPSFTIALRVVCIVVLLMSLTRLDGERLSQLFAVLFAMISGMALLWEDAVVSNLNHLFGGALWRLKIPSSWQSNLQFAIQ